MTRTNDVIDLLVADATPIRRLRPPAVRAAYWLLCALLIILFVGVAHGLRADLMLKLGQPRFLIGVGAAMATGVLS